MKKIKEDTNKWKGILCLGLEELLFLKCPHHPKLSIDLLQSLSKSNGTCHKNGKKKILFEMTEDLE